MIICSRLDIAMAYIVAVQMLQPHENLGLDIGWTEGKGRLQWDDGERAEDGGVMVCAGACVVCQTR